jgi:hypothetical protein
MEGTIKKVKDKYFFILIPDSRQIFGHTSSWLSYPGPRMDDVVEFDLVPSLKPQYKDQAANVKRIGSASTPIADAVAALAEPMAATVPDNNQNGTTEAK